MLKETKRQKLKEVKIKTKNEIEIAKKEHIKYIQKLQAEIEQSKIKGKNLSLKLEKEFQDFKQKQKKEELENQKNVNEQISLINENKKIISDTKKEINKENQLQKADAKNKLSRLQKEQKQRIIHFKNEAKKQRKEQRLELKKIQNEIIKKRNESKREIANRNQELLQEQLKKKEFLGGKRQEILEQKQDLHKKLNENKIKFKKQKNEKLIEAKKEQQQLKLDKIKAKSDIRKKIIEIKLQNANEQEEKQILLNKLEEENKILENDLKIQEQKFKQELEDTFVNENSSFDKLEKKQSVNSEGLKTSEKISKNATILENRSNDTQEQKEEKQNDLNEKQINLEEAEWNPLEKSVIENSRKFIAGLQPYKFKPKKRDKILDSFNSKNNKYKLSNFSLNIQEEIKKFRELEKQKSLANIKDFTQYASFVSGKKWDEKKVEAKFKNILANILKGNILQFLNGYLKLQREKNYWKLVFVKSLQSQEKSHIISLKQNAFYEFLNFYILDCLDRGTIIKINANVCLLMQNQEITFIHDVGFLKRK